jgi:DNA-binding XRE family transcriptional regulator
MKAKIDGRRGYSSSLARIVWKADQTLPEVKFARYCIENDISAIKVAQAFGVSRATVYFWFKGVYKPRERHMAAMIDVLKEVGLHKA